MEFIKEGLKFSNWGQVYIGVKKGWISVEVVQNLFSEKLIAYDADKDARIYLALEKSHFALLEEIKNFINEDNYPPIDIQDYEIVEPNNPKYYDYPVYWDIWEIELLLRFRNNHLSEEDALEKIRVLHYDFAYIFNWYSFNPLYIRKNKKKEQNDFNLYQNCKTYLNYKIELYKLNMPYF